MLCVLYLSHMVGVTNARFRFAYAPFFLLYLSLLVEWIAAGVAAIRERRCLL